MSDKKVINLRDTLNCTECGKVVGLIPRGTNVISSDLICEECAKENLLMPEIETYALDQAFEFFFCNVNEDSWPSDPVSLLRSGRLEDNDKEMIIWQPFENDSAKEILDRVLAMASSYEDAMLWALDHFCEPSKK